MTAAVQKYRTMSSLMLAAEQPPIGNEIDREQNQHGKMSGETLCREAECWTLPCRKPESMLHACTYFGASGHDSQLFISSSASLSLNRLNA